MQIISNIALITINETVIVQAISFLIFLFLLNRIMISPLRTAIADRDQYLEQTRRGIVEAKQKLVELTDQIASQEAEARKEATGIRRQLESAGTKAAEDILSKTRQAIAVEKDKATREMDARIAATRKSLQDETETLAINVMEKILHRGIE
jgi:F-type H+-transporting ATPase subunit b